MVVTEVDHYVQIITNKRDSFFMFLSYYYNYYYYYYYYYYNYYWRGVARRGELGAVSVSGF